MIEPVLPVRIMSEGWMDGSTVGERSRPFEALSPTNTLVYLWLTSLRACFGAVLYM
jgi:hypothetical protein